MTILTRYYAVSLFSSISVNAGKYVFFILRHTSIYSLPKVKHKRFIVPTPFRTYMSSSLFALKKDTFEDIGLNKTHTVTDIERLNFLKSLATILQCSEKEVDQLCLDHEQLEKLNTDKVKTQVRKLQLYGIKTSSIKQHVWILFYTIHQLSSRLELLKRWKFTNLNNGLGMIQLPFAKLQRLTFQTEREFDLLDGKNRITYFSSYINCDEKEACQLFLKYSFMMTIKVEALKSILIMTKEVGVVKEDLMNDLWLFRYKPQFIADRIHFLDQVEAKEKCKVIKPWILRCPESTLQRYFELKDENIAALGSYSNLKDLLSNELDISSEDVEEMFTKHPPLTKIRYSKCKEMIDFLKSEGFSSQMIQQVPRVLCHKQATLLARMLEMKKINPRIMSLQNLCRNKKDYLAFLNKFQISHS